jgi:hypothetical protein
MKLPKTKKKGLVTNMARPDFAQASVPLGRAQSTIQRLLDEGNLPEGAQSALQGVQENLREAKEQVERGDSFDVGETAN